LGFFGTRGPLKRSFHSPTRAQKTQFTQQLVK
jgi:hypothetical protein